MLDVLLKILPVILIFVAGYVLKLAGIFKKDSGEMMLKIVFHVSLPALLIVSLQKIQLTWEFGFFPVVSGLVIFLSFLIAFFFARFFSFSRATKGTFLVGSSILNIGFLFPFVIAAFGTEGLVKISLFDLTNGVLVYTFIYYIACRYGHNGKDSGVYKKLISSFPLWGIVIGIILNLTETTMPVLLSEFLQLCGDLTIPLIMLALGCYFRFRIVHPKALFSVIAIRMVAGLAMGYFFALLLGLQGMDRALIILGSGTPIGFNTLVFSSMENLDTDFAASLVSISILIGIISIPFIIVSLA